MNEELELKYSIADPAAVERAIDELFPRAKGERWRRFALTDRYFDTADEGLRRAGVGARLRRAHRRTLLTLKSDIEIAGARHRRIELEAPASQWLVAARWPASEARDRLLSITGGTRLIDSFLVRGVRRERRLELNGAQLSVCIDTMLVEWCGVRAGGLRQLELELIAGEPGGLARIGEAFEATGLGEPEPRSKLVAADEMAREVARVRPDDRFSEAGRKVMRRHLVRMIEREAAVRQGDRLALKQMRVATRRMRATWRVFGSAYRRTEVERYLAELRRVARALGEVRDMDVQLAGLSANALGIDELAAVWQQRRGSAWNRLAGVLDSAAYRRFVDDYLHLTGERGLAVAKGHRARSLVAANAHREIGAGERRFRLAEAAALQSSDDSAWHALRIAAKRLRYTLEAFREVLDPESAGAAIEPLRSLQDLLGEMNDAAVAAREAEDWFGAVGASLEPERRDAVARFIGERRLAVARFRRAYAASWAEGIAIDVRLVRMPRSAN